MAAAESETDKFIKQVSGRNTRGLLRVIILCLIAGAAVASRLFSVIRFESIIHECEDANWMLAGCGLTGMQSIRGSIFEPPSISFRMASTASGTGLTTVSTLAPGSSTPIREHRKN